MLGAIVPIGLYEFLRLLEYESANPDRDAAQARIKDEWKANTKKTRATLWLEESCSRESNEGALNVLEETLDREGNGMTGGLDATASGASPAMASAEAFQASHGGGMDRQCLRTISVTV
ncbi:uncharacterized protein N0V89_012538 [Didymosphaeria variabile]|uniref:Uncharacterized protein n=1 Tax=Didymosphaeria variabile TaxID=1932322 RepID=A0A9W8X9C6_9PLEO|nr:uncharacterized protein N0V89_012538 [Didymosphaeria variabile]KAJ4344794.1 hypothetical protein N0V89_012538 [Didymosphaeria variabile]